MTNQQTETKPFRSLADVYREKGLCECGCGREADSTLDESWTKEAALWGARVTRSVGCGENWVEKVRKNRSTPAPETGGEKPRFEIGMRVRHADAWLGNVCLLVRDDFIRVDGDDSDKKNYGDDASRFAPVFDFGPFIQADWDWLLGEARKQDPEAVVFLVSGGLVASRLDGSGRLHDYGDIADRRFSAIRVQSGFKSYFYEARSERRIYPDDCPDARARWGVLAHVNKVLAEETDEQWLKRVVFELTGIHAVVRLELTWVVESSDPRIKPGNGTLCILSRVEMGYPEERRRAECERMLRLCGWPIKDSAGVGDSSESNVAQAADAEKRSKPTPAEATTWGIPRPVETAAREPCGEGCRCVYCTQRVTEPLKLNSRSMDWHKVEIRNEQARHRLALMDEREKPRATRWSRELERAHPWSNDDDS